MTLYSSVYIGRRMNEAFQLSDERTCRLRASLAGIEHLEILYDANAGLRRTATLAGNVTGADEYSSPAERSIEFKPLWLSVHSPLNPEWHEEIKELRNVEHACGVIMFRSNEDLDGGESEPSTLEVASVAVEIVVDNDTFDAICEQAKQAGKSRSTMRATFTLSGNSLPEVPDHSRPIIPSLSGSCDLSDVIEAWRENQQPHAVRDFELSCAIDTEAG